MAKMERPKTQRWGDRYSQRWKCQESEMGTGGRTFLQETGGHMKVRENQRQRQGAEQEDVETPSRSGTLGMWLYLGTSVSC